MAASPVDLLSEFSKNKPGRQGIKRVKSGCKTCKIRRVKCDEKKPACDRCISTGRTCDGYGIWGNGGNYYGSRQNKQSRRSSSSDSFDSACSARGLPYADKKCLTPKANADEASCFEFFHARTMLKLPGYFNSEFWERIVLQISSSEPAVFHAVLALVSTQRSQEMDGCMRPDSDSLSVDYDVEMSKWDRFALQHYNKAIVQLQTHIQKNNHESVRVALTACILFTCVELMRGCYASANMHIDHGIKVLRNLKGRSTMGKSSPSATLIRSSDLTTIDDHLLETFARMNIQSMLFGYPSQFLHVTKDDDAYRQRYEPPNMFSTLEEARQPLEVLLNGILHLADEAREPDLSLDKAAKLLCQREELQDSLKYWVKIFDNSVAMLLPSLNVRQAMGLTVLQVYCIMAEIMIGTCPIPNEAWSEMVYDEYNSKFTEIVTKLSDIISLRNIPVHYIPDFKNCHIGPYNFCADIGLIAPLYYIAVKCRVPSVRRAAINLLNMAPHREVLWDGVAVAAAAKTVVNLEELGWTPDEICSSETSFPPAQQPLPDSYRFENVQIVMDDGISEKGKVICKKRIKSGIFFPEFGAQTEWEVIEEDFEYKRVYTHRFF
ncbi:hypothetical protein BGW36DRAFT_395302 [Talaromyces proteolyticus]|uniref:Zn(2)-C6 fungal-type domain-containing protein n=1 Tax=Talaromyces proteolyticus TaxID=1131652 RepID=A0AAD4Q2B3_9EURO|nr:uncharacterized protein BGW36DRAFT_395302 [Talaromyces proteolyticus]KAH8700148.1 hypothetical protein BGW36DRAFT_395302 [Talaromyces proteolyticus]